MNHNLADFLNHTLYPLIFRSIDIILPEFNFIFDKDKWRSSRKIDLSLPRISRKDKTVITSKHPTLILEQGGEVIPIITYIMKRDNINFYESVKNLANIVGLSVPNDSSFDIAKYQRQRDKLSLLEYLNNYFVYLLTDANSSGGEDRDRVIEYLSKRGYDEDSIKQMELGYVPSQDRIFKYLEAKGLDTELIEESFIINKKIGSSHKLSIPYRVGGNIKGFKFRTIDDTNTPKYLNTTGLEKNSGFFNIPLNLSEENELIIVEGELDCLHASVKGISNVVATAGNSINEEQILDAQRRGAKKYTLCFDNDNKNTLPNNDYDTTIRAINTIIKYSDNVYVALLPAISDEKTDPDKLIRDKGIEYFKNIIAEAIPYYLYLLQHIINKYNQIEVNQGQLYHKDIDNFLEDVIITSSQIKSQIHKDIFLSKFSSIPIINSFGITTESIQLTVEKIKASREKDAQIMEFKKVLAEASYLQQKGELYKAFDLLDTKLKNIKTIDKKSSFEKLLTVNLYENVLQHFKNTADSLDSGYKIKKSLLLLPSGAITGVAGATNHGKTDFLINLTLNSINNYSDKEFFFFTYEMSAESIIVRFLNTYLQLDLESESNQRAIKTYFKTLSTKYIKSTSIEQFKAKTNTFFNDIMKTGRLRVISMDYNSSELNSAILHLKKQSNIGGVFIDYLQLLRLPKEGYKNYSRQEELKVICQDLNVTAKDTQIPIIIGAQFNREVTNPFKLHATNIGEAGDIERILDTLIGIWNTNKQPFNMTSGESNDFKNKNFNEPNKLYVEILKSRETASGINDFLEYNGKLGKISNPEIDTF